MKKEVGRNLAVFPDENFKFSLLVFKKMEASLKHCRELIH